MLSKPMLYTLAFNFLYSTLNPQDCTDSRKLNQFPKVVKKIVFQEVVQNVINYITYSYKDLKIKESSS